LMATSPGRSSSLTLTNFICSLLPVNGLFQNQARTRTALEKCHRMARSCFCQEIHTMRLHAHSLPIDGGLRRRAIGPLRGEVSAREEQRRRVSAHFLHCRGAIASCASSPTD
jgi:hypothetical protein